MAPSNCTELTGDDRRALLRIARLALEDAVLGRPGAAAVTELTPGLSSHRGAFVTLTRNGRLRGCIGALEPREALARTVAAAARDAALADPRFPGIRSEELASVHIEISVLSPLEELAADSRQTLERALVPGRDGLSISEGEREATFLPKVWEQLPQASEFVARLLEKAGLPADHWSGPLRCRTYTGESIAECSPAPGEPAHPAG